MNLRCDRSRSHGSRAPSTLGTVPPGLSIDDPALRSFAGIGERLRDVAAVGLATVTRGVVRATRAGSGSSLPGLIADKVSPRLLSRLASRLPQGVVVVSGTNGKTTTTSMITAIMKAAGLQPVSNDTGANLRQGVVGAMVGPPPHPHIAVLEVDEGALASLMPALRPRVMVLTNIFRDQMDRFGETERVAELLSDAADQLPGGTTIVANADDPLLWVAVGDRGARGFGIRSVGLPTAPHQRVEPEICARCGSRLRYRARTIAHLGTADCLRCGWRSGDRCYEATIKGQGGLRFLDLELHGATVRLQVGGIHNAYNAIAAVATADVLGVPSSVTIAALERFRPRFGRAEELRIGGRSALLTLMKNPAGAEALIQEITHDPQIGAVVVAVSDAFADGRDISWIWDVDLESLTARFPVVASGTRALDVAVRLKYAGGDPGDVSERPLDALRLALDHCPPPSIPVVLATYSAMLDLRGAALGHVARLRD